MRSGALYWALHRVSGVLLVGGMAMHFYVMHFGGADAVTHAAVLDRLGRTEWVAFNLILLGLVVYHGLYGLMGIVREYVSSERTVSYAKSGLIVTGCLLMGYGASILIP